MAHLDEGTLQGYLDDELPGRDRAAAAEHLLVCGECRAGLDALKRANERLASALAALDAPAPAAGPRAALRRRFGFGGGSLVRAAVLVLLLAAAASATVPGSPVRDWIVQVVRAPAAAPESAAPVPGPVLAPAVQPESAPAGVAIPGGRDVDVVITGLEGGAIRLVRTDGPAVAVSVRDCAEDPLFRMGSGRVEVLGGAGGEVIVEVPRAGGSFRLIVDGRAYAEALNGTLRLLVPAEEHGEAVVWR